MPVLGVGSELVLARLVLPSTVIVLAFILRLIPLAELDLGMDGGLSLAIASLGPQEVLSISERDVHPQCTICSCITGCFSSG